MSVPDEHGIILAQLIHKDLPHSSIQYRMPLRAQKRAAFLCHFLHKLNRMCQKLLFNPGPHPAAVFLSVQKPGIIRGRRQLPQVVSDHRRENKLDFFFAGERKPAFRRAQDSLVLDFLKYHIDRKRMNRTLFPRHFFPPLFNVCDIMTVPAPPNAEINKSAAIYPADCSDLPEVRILLFDYHITQICSPAMCTPV